MKLSISPSDSTVPVKDPSLSFSLKPGAKFFRRVLSARSTLVDKGNSNLRGSLGLTTIFDPSDPLIEYVFIHGLGGGSTKTWCLQPDLSYFWPKEWLPHHPSFRNVRIHTFGYDSDWEQKGGATCLDVQDFGQALLAGMRNSENFGTVSMHRRGILSCQLTGFRITLYLSGIAWAVLWRKRFVPSPTWTHSRG